VNLMEHSIASILMDLEKHPDDIELWMKLILSTDNLRFFMQNASVVELAILKALAETQLTNYLESDYEEKREEGQNDNENDFRLDNFALFVYGLLQLQADHPGATDLLKSAIETGLKEKAKLPPLAFLDYYQVLKLLEHAEKSVSQNKN